MIRRNDNYFDYYLNKYWKNKKIPLDKSSISQFSLLSDKILYTEIKQIINDDYFLKTIYDQYLNLKNENKTLDFLYELLKKIDKFNDINELFIFLMDYSMDPFIGIDVILNPFDDINFSNNIQIVCISVDSLSLPNKLYYTDPNNKYILDEFHKYQNKLLDKLNLLDSINLNIINDIEYELAKRSHTIDESRDYDKKFNKISIDKIINKYDNINWKKIFLNIEKDKFIGNLEGMYDNKLYDKLMISYDIDSNDTPYDYINLLFNEIDKSKMYIKWKIINNLVVFLKDDISDISYNFYNKFLLDQKEKKTQEYKALIYISGVYGNYISQIYMKRYHDNKINSEIKLLIKYIKITLRDSIIKNTWMENVTKKKALIKLKKMKYIIGSSRDNYDYRKIITNMSDNFMENKILIHKLYKYYEFYKLKTQNKIKDPITSYDVNAYYDPLFNFIVIPAGILKNPFYYKNNFLDNFGAIGLVIGHEITHGFDSQSSKIDDRGKYINWWDKDDFKKYNNFIEPLIKQYDETKIEEADNNRYFNGKQIIQEAIAELYGITLSLRSLKLHCKLNNIKITRRILKRFFKAYCIIWLSKHTKKTFIYKAINDVHPIAKYRVNNIVKNLDEFHICYKTNPKDKMYLSHNRRVKLI